MKSPNKEPEFQAPNIPIEQLLVNKKKREEELKKIYPESVIKGCQALLYQLSQKKLQVQKIEEDMKALRTDINNLSKLKDNLHQFVKTATIYLSPLPQIPKIIVLFFVILLSVPFVLSSYSTSSGFFANLVFSVVSFSLIIVFQYATGKCAKAVHYAPFLPTGDLDQTQAKKQLILSSAISISLGVALLFYLEVQKASLEERALGWTTLGIVLFATLLFTLWILVVIGAAKKEIFNIIDFLEYVQEKPSEVEGEYHNKKDRLKRVRKRLKQLDEEIQLNESSLFTLRVKINHLTEQLSQKLEEYENEH